MYLRFGVITISLIVFCEFIIYYLVIWQCKWPSSNEQSTSLKAMILADTHLLGPRRGHWFDKLRREWQMHRAFQSAVSIFSPEVVFVLGDLFDEGDWVNKKEFDNYVARFHSLFALPDDIPMHVAAGNHDMGFHYVISIDRLNRFNFAFKSKPVDLIQMKGCSFVLINSMAMEGDECSLCKPARIKLSLIAKQLQNTKEKYARPIVLQHFPMYRKSDEDCNESDEAPEKIKNVAFRPRWDCLSEDATAMILDKLNPRAIITGHTHHGCHIVHRNDIHEYTVPSFSWRNKNNPTFMLATFTPDNYTINRCHLPEETTVIAVYSIGFIAILFLLICNRRSL